MTRIPSVSVVIPVFNRAHCLERAVRSVMNQTLPVTEVIIIDDGSTDGSVELGKQLESTFDTVRFIGQANSGPGAARNLGVENSVGEWIAFLDSDDEWVPDKNRLSVERIVCDPDLTLVHTAVLADDGATLVNKNDRVFREDPVSMLSNFGIKTSSVMILKTLIQAVGGFSSDLRMCEDFELFWKVIVRGGRIGYCEKGLVNVYDSEDGLMASEDIIERYKKDLLAIIRVIDWMSNQEINRDYSSALGRLRRTRVREVFVGTLKSGRIRDIFETVLFCYRMSGGVLGFTKALSKY